MVNQTPRSSTSQLPFFLRVVPPVGTKTITQASAAQQPPTAATASVPRRWASGESLPSAQNGPVPLAPPEPVVWRRALAERLAAGAMSGHQPTLPRLPLRVALLASFARNHVNAAMAKGKIIGQYTNSILAKREALQHGYQEAIMMDTSGFISEATGENIFIVRSGIVRTPPMSSAILGGITRQTVMHLCAELGLEVSKARITRDQLYVADECFLTGTAAEVTPVREVDNRVLGEGTRGPVTEQVQNLFFGIVRGEISGYDRWLTFYNPRKRL